MHRDRTGVPYREDEHASRPSAEPGGPAAFADDVGLCDLDRLRRVRKRRRGRRHDREADDTYGDACLAPGLGIGDTHHTWAGCSGIRNGQERGEVTVRSDPRVDATD